MNIFKFVFVAIFATATPLLGKGTPSVKLDLKTAEKKSLENEFDIQKTSLDKEIGSIHKHSLWGQWLPSVSLSSSFSKDDSVPFQKKGSFLTWEETLANPWRWYNDLQSLSFDDRITAETAKDLQKNLLLNVRNQYFNVVRWKEKIALKEKTLSMVHDLKSMTEMKYNKGLTDVISFERCKLLVVNEEIDYREMQKKYEIELVKFYRVLYGKEMKPAESPVVLTSMFQMEKALRNFSLHGLQKKKSSPLIDKAYFLMEKANLETEKFYSSWLPNLSVSGTYPIGKASQAASVPSQEYQVKLTWNIFSGGRDFWTYEENKAKSLKLGLDLKKEEVNYQSALDETDLSLKRVKEKWASKNELVSSWEKITKDMKNKYQQGLVNLRDLHSDMKSYLDLMSDIEDLKFEYMQNMVKALQLADQESEFYTYLK